MAQRIIDRSYVGEVLQHIYASELDIKITFASEGGYFYMTADGKKEPLHGTTIEEAITHLAFRLSHEFPSSRFTSWWAIHFRGEDIQ
jgi:hypothetical protein